MSEKSTSESLAPTISGDGLGISTPEIKKSIFSELEQASKSPDEKGTVETPEGEQEEGKPEVPEVPAEEVETPSEEEQVETEEPAEETEEAAEDYLKRAKKLDLTKPEDVQKLAEMYQNAEKLAKGSAREQGEIKRQLEELKQMVRKPEAERTPAEKIDIQAAKKELNEKFWPAFEENPVGAISELIQAVFTHANAPRQLAEDKRDVDDQLKRGDETYGKKLIENGMGETWKKIKVKAAAYIENNPAVMQEENALDRVYRSVMGDMVATGEIASIFKKAQPKPVKTTSILTTKGGGLAPKPIVKPKQTAEDEILSGIIGVGATKGNPLNF